MDLNFSAFQEPRGVMRILHFVFSICAFATVTGYSGYIKYNCFTGEDTDYFSYPFSFVFPGRQYNNGKKTCNIQIISPPSSDVKFFVATGVLTMLYTLAIIIIYVKFDDKYKKDTKLPLIDFILTVVFGVLWLSSSAAWANSLVSLKEVTNAVLLGDCAECSIKSSNFSTLNISVVLGFLNFFLWAADLWFVYKETSWFQGKQQQATSGV